MDFLLENLGKIGFEWKMALFNLINFLILVWILKRWFFKPVTTTINERHKKVKESVENIERAKTELSMAEQKAQSIIDEAKIAGNKVREKATEDGKMITEKMKEKARGEIELLISQAKRNIEIDRTKMQEELRAETVALVAAALEKIIGEKMDAKKQEAYIKDILKTVE